MAAAVPDSSTPAAASRPPGGPPSKLSNDELPAAFWDSYPQDQDNPDMAAINALLEEDSLEERVDTLKAQGNEALKRGLQLKKAFYLHEALRRYDAALGLKPRDAAQRSVVHSNRAQVNLLLGNNRAALDDGLEAMKADSSNVKACFRAAKAAKQLGEAQRALDIAAGGLARFPGAAPELEPLRGWAEGQLAERRAAEVAAAAERQAKLGPALMLANVFQERGWRVGLPHENPGQRCPSLDAEGFVHWPLLLVYPEITGMVDTVDDVREDDTLQDVLDLVVKDLASMEWNGDGRYSSSSLELYYATNAAHPLSTPQLAEALVGGWKPTPSPKELLRYGPQASSWRRADPSAALGSVLRAPGLVVAGFPTFFAVPAGTAFRDRFLTDGCPARL